MTRRGLTALELVVGLAITAVATTIGTATFALLNDQRDRLRGDLAAFEHAAAVRRTIVDWLGGMHSHSATSGIARPTFQLLDRGYRGRHTDELLVETSAPTKLSAVGGNALVRLYVDDDPRTIERGLVAELTTTSALRTVRLQLDSTVVELDVRCLTDLLGARRWVSSWLSDAVLPRGIELRMRAARDTPIDPLMALPLLVAVQGGQ